MIDRSRISPLVWAGAAVVLVQGVVLSLVFQPMPHPGGDNAAYLTLAHSLLERGAYLELWEPGEPGHAKYPPVFPLMLAGAMALGAVTWTAFKWLSALFVSLAVLFAFAWAGERRGALFAAALAVLLVLSDAFLHASQWVLSEPPFLALTLVAVWAGDRAGFLPGLRERWGRTPGGTPRGRRGRGGGRGERGERGGASLAPGAAGTFPWPWVAVVCGLAVLAYFTRSAGLPLVVAVGVWLALGGRWRTLGVFAAAFAVPALLWLLRARRVGEDDYVAEFWLVNPYEPGLGTIGVGDLVARIIGNVRTYVLDVFPTGLVGSVDGWAAPLGVALAVLALVGWGRRIWWGPGVAELFAPLYLGLILLWPEVWSGDRFALPLYPLLVLYAGESLLDGSRRLGKAAPLPTGALAFLLLALPALGGWMDRVSVASECREAVEEEGPYACQPPGQRVFNQAAAWSTANLPGTAVVYSRKPRIFYLLSGVPSRMYPLSQDPGALLGDADDIGVGFLLLDQVDGLSIRYLLPAVEARPGAFCHVEGWEDPAGAQAFLLGIRPPTHETDSDGPRLGEVPGEGITPCPAGRLAVDGRSAPDLGSTVVPLLEDAGR